MAKDDRLEELLGNGLPLPPKTEQSVSQVARALLGQAAPTQKPRLPVDIFDPVDFGAFAPAAKKPALPVDPFDPGYFGDLWRPAPNALSSKFAPLPQPIRATPRPAAAPLRMVYFAFSFADVMRVNNVRQFGKVGPEKERSESRAFRDRSIWESRDIKQVEGLKNLMRNGVKHSSVVCALVGSTTCNSRWVKYEIARAVVDGKGLLAVHLNSINHHERKAPDRPGVSPLHVMGIFRADSGNYYLVDKHPVLLDAATGNVGFEWRLYEDHKTNVPLPSFMPELNVGDALPLSPYVREYDMVRDRGYQNLWGWIETAVIAAGR